jgi:hypothetical protein
MLAHLKLITVHDCTGLPVRVGDVRECDGVLGAELDLKALLYWGRGRPSGRKVVMLMMQLLSRMIAKSHLIEIIQG